MDHVHDETIDSDLLLEHEYDGILEYDNPLPGWWVWTFIATIVFCLPYVTWYHFGDGLSIWEKLDRDMGAKAEADQQKYGNLKGDRDTIVEYMDSEKAMSSMASIFESKCALCHLNRGQGSVGPNLTDDVWISIQNVTDLPPFITDGAPTKGMPEWGSKLSESEIVLMSSYIAQLGRGYIAPPFGKDPQGEPIEDWPE